MDRRIAPIDGLAAPRSLLVRFIEQAAGAMQERRNDLGLRIAEAREARGWRQKDLAAAVHVEITTVSRWENGRHTPSLEMLERIAEATNRELSFFLEEKEPTRGGSVVDAEAVKLLVDEIRSLRAGQDEHARRQEEVRGLLGEIVKRLDSIEARQAPKPRGRATG